METDSRWADAIAARPGDSREQEFGSWRSASRGAMAVLLLYLLFEYLRLHEILPILGKLKVQTAVFAILIMIVISEIGKGRVRLSRQSWLLLGFLGLTVFTILTAANNYYAYYFAYTLALILIGYFAITHILQNERDLKRLLSVLVGIHIYLAMKGILGYVRSEFDPRGYTPIGNVGGSFLGDENDLALAMVLILPLAVYLFRHSRSLPEKIFWGGGSLAILLTIIFTFSRGGFVGLAMMVLYWVATSRNKRKAIGTLALATVLVIAVTPPEYWARIETIADTDAGTARLRRNYWAAAGRMFLDSPIWGVGGFNYNVLVPEYATDFTPELRENQWGRVAHNTYLQLLAEFGLLGVFLIGALLLSNFRDLRQVVALGREGSCPPSMGELANFLRISWVGFLISATFVTVHYYPHLYYLTALTVVVHRLALAESTDMEIEPIRALEGAG